ncbi:MAG: cation diffusion facilitator family transporter [Elusimicrobia bacterium]|nr:cation diffusion facilitator family transporter [Elusimicrobiota bacterium]
MSSAESARVVLVAFGANLGIAFAKFVGAFFSGSAALLAEAIHSLVDTANQVLLLIGHRAARQPPGERHPLGHGRESFFWSFLVAMLLFSLGGMAAIYEGVHKLRSPEPLSTPWVGLAILVVSIALECVSYRACIKEIRRRRPGVGLWTWFRRSSSVELAVVFMEDTAALAGLGVAVVALSAAWMTGNPSFDAAGSIAVGAVLVVVAVLLALKIKSLLIGQAPSEDYRSEIDALVAAEIPGGRVLRLAAIITGVDEVMIAYKVHPGQLKDVAVLIEACNRVEAAVKARFPKVRWQFIEPDFEA